jgi:hypothetical protein
MSNNVLSQQITDIREKYRHIVENMKEEKSRFMKILEKNINEFVRSYKSDLEVKVT